jgi:hypothetical protein
MKHLSEEELLDFIDRRSGAGRDDAARHIAGCERCKTIVALQQQIRSHAARVDEGMLSKNFTKRVLHLTNIPHAAPRFSWLYENTANLFAMVFVVGIVGVIIYAVTQSAPGASDSVYTRQIALWNEAYGSVVKAFASGNRNALIPVVTDSHNIFTNVFWTGIGALILFGSLDKLRVFAKIIKTR